MPASAQETAEDDDAEEGTEGRVALMRMDWRMASALAGQSAFGWLVVEQNSDQNVRGAAAAA